MSEETFLVALAADVDLYTDDEPEGYMCLRAPLYIDDFHEERVQVEIWKSGNVWKWSVMEMESGDGPSGTAKTRKEAIEKALDALERMKKEIEEFVQFEEEFAIRLKIEG